MVKVIEQIQLRRGTAADWMSANTILASGEPGFETDTLKHKIGDGVTAWADLGYAGGAAEESAGGSVMPRTTSSVTTASLADQTAESGTIDLAGGYRVIKIDTSVPARVRLYASAAQRDADVDRAVGDDPTGDHGLMLEYITAAGLLSAIFSPTVDGYLTDARPTPTEVDPNPPVPIPYSITNLSGAASAVTATLTWQKTE